MRRSEDLAATTELHPFIGSAFPDSLAQHSVEGSYLSLHRKIKSHENVPVKPAYRTAMQLLYTSARMSRPFAEHDFIGDIFLFVEVARQRSFSRAAVSLQVSPSLLSRRIAGLEKRLGLQLIQRTTRKLELTDSGALYFERCSLLVAEARSIDEQMQQRISAPQGHLRIAMPVDFGLVLLPSLLEEFSALYPEISVECDISTQGVDLMAGHFDLAIQFGDLPDSTLVMHPLVSFQNHIYAAPAYLKRWGTPRHPNDLSAHECIRISGTTKRSTWSLHKDKESIDVLVQGRLTLNNMSMLNRLVSSGIGIGILADFVARDNLRAGVLVRLLHSWSMAALPVVAISTTRMLPAKTKVFIEFLRTRLASFRGETR